MKKNIAVLGAGYWGKNLIRNFSELGALKYIFDYDPKRNSDFCKEYALEIRDLSQILDDDGIEGIVIATPANSHYEICKLCLEHNKNIFVEKPITLNVKEAEELISISKNNNRILMVGHLLHYHNHFIKFKELISEKKENPLRVVSLRKSPGKIRDNENVLWSFAPHDISMINSIIPGKISNIKKLERNYFNNNQDSVFLSFHKGQNKTFIDIEVDWVEINKIQRISAYFSDEIIVFEDSEPDHEKKLYKLSIPFTKTQLMSKSNSDKSYIKVDKNNPLRSECKHFLDCISNESNPFTDGIEALEVLKYLILLDEA